MWQRPERVLQQQLLWRYVAEHVRAGPGHGLFHGREWHFGLRLRIAIANANCDSYCYCDSNSYAYTDIDADSYCYGDSHSDSYAYPDSYGDSDSHGNSYSNVTASIADDPAEADPDAEGTSDTAASPVVRSGSDK
jgi:hypothetical protein